MNPIMFGPSFWNAMHVKDRLEKDTDLLCLKTFSKFGRILDEFKSQILITKFRFGAYL